MQANINKEEQRAKFMNDYAYEIKKYNTLYNSVSSNFEKLKATSKNLRVRLEESENIRKQQENTIAQLKQVIRDLKRGRRNFSP